MLVTTLTKKMAEDLTDYLLEMGVRVRYLHSEVDTLQRIELVRDLRLGEFDVLVGINLLREGLDIPEVSLVAILDADKEGFLRSETSLIQMIGRAARNVNGEVVMYADRVTDSMTAGHLGDQPTARAAAGLQRGARDRPDDHPQGGHRHPGRPAWLVGGGAAARTGPTQAAPGGAGPGRAVRRSAARGPRPTDPVLEDEMNQASADLRFEEAARLRDEVKELKRELRNAGAL